MSEQPIRVLIADDHVPVRAGVKRALDRAGLVVCADCASGEEAVEQAVVQRPDVCLLDIHMPGMGGIAAAAEISSRLPGIAILMLTVSDDDADLLAALRSGASGYLLKGIDPRRLPEAVRGALEGDAVIPRAMAARAIRPFHEGSPERRALAAAAEDLSDRECDVLELLNEGRGTAEVAGELGISPITVRRHLSEIMRKLDVTSREEALRIIASGGRPNSRSAGVHA